MALTPMAGAETYLSPEQLRNEAIVQEEWGTIEYPETGLAICMQESSLRTHVRADTDKPNQSYGLCGVTYAAFLDVQKRNPDIAPNMDRKRVIGMLIYNPRFNAMIGALYFYQLRQRMGTWRKAVAAYAGGPTGWENGIPYRKKIARRIVRGWL